MLEISSLSNSLVKELVSLKQKKNREKLKLFIVEDIDLIDEAFKKNIVKQLLFVKENKFKNIDCEFIKVTPEIINKISNIVTPTGYIAVCKMLDTSTKGSKVIALDDVQDPGNGGTILRSALAFEFDEMLLSEKSFDNYNDKFIRSTKGAFFSLPVNRVNLVKTLKQRKSEGYEIVVADLKEDAIKVNDLKPISKMILVVGNEGNGISEDILEIATKVVYIPISSNMESLNVGVAASIIMQHLYK